MPEWFLAQAELTAWYEAQHQWGWLAVLATALAMATFVMSTLRRGWSILTALLSVVAIGAGAGVLLIGAVFTLGVGVAVLIGVVFTGRFLLALVGSDH